MVQEIQGESSGYTLDVLKNQLVRPFAIPGTANTKTFKQKLVETNVQDIPHGFMSYLQTCKHKMCFQITQKFLNVPLSFTHSRATYILRHYTSQPASVGYGRMYTLHPPPKTLEGSTTTERWLTCHHRCACASINKSGISKTQIRRWRRARHSRTYKHNQSCISKKRACMHPCSMG